MSVIDADAHVIEYQHTWDFLNESELKFRPNVEPRKQGGEGGDGVVLPEAAFYPRDVQARIRHMDEMGTDIQVLYPTHFIRPYANEPAQEIALCRTYNRWLAEIWAEGAGRIRWAAVLPLMSMDQALEELGFCQEHGACAVFVRGLEVGNRTLSNPYFFPLYEEASRRNMPVAVHTGSACREIDSIFPNDTFVRNKALGLGAFHTLIAEGIPAQFPDLRFGFIEYTSEWLPYVMSDLRHRFNRAGKPISGNATVLADNRIWVAMQSSDDLPRIIQEFGEDNFVLGTDYGHAASATEIYALQNLSKNPEISESARRKILDDNSVALYAL